MRLQPQAEVALQSHSERDLAKRSVSGSMAYVVVSLTAAYGTPYGVEHPHVVAAAVAITGALGTVRLILGMRLAKASREALLRWRSLFRAATFGLFVFWGLFSALTLELYRFSWTTMLVLFATSAFAGGATSSLAPAPSFGRVCLVAIILPPTIWGAWNGQKEGYSLFIFGTIYLAFLLVQIHQHWEVYRSTSLAATQEANVEHERLFHAAFEAAGAGMGLLTLDGRFSRVNGRLCELLGTAEVDLLSSDLQSFFPSIDLPVDAGARPPQNGPPWLESEHRFERAEGESVWLSATLAAVGGRADKLRYYVLLVRDVTERKQAEGERKDMEKHLIQAQKLESIGALAGGVAHDFNNLLSVIIGYTELAIEDASGKAVESQLKEILKAGERAESLTSQLLAFGRAQVLNPERTNLNALLEKTRDLIGRTLGEDIELRFDLDHRIPDALVDAGQMQQVFLNLTLNARDAMPSGGILTIRTWKKSEDAIGLSFHDTGVAMDAETQRRAFEPFFTTKPVGEGAGLGLSSAHGIISQSGGEITISSQPGDGTAVFLTLPVAETTGVAAIEASKQEASALERPAAGPVASATVLVVEDEESLRKLAGKILRAAGYEVLTAANGGEALDLASSHRGEIDLLLTDVIMPQVGGKQVASELSRIRPRLTVVFMTGYSEQRTRLDQALSAGASLLRKPFTRDQLLAAVRQALGRKSARDHMG